MANAVGAAEGSESCLSGAGLRSGIFDEARKRSLSLGESGPDDELLGR